MHACLRLLVVFALLGCGACGKRDPQTRHELAERFAKHSEPDSFALFVRDVDHWVRAKWWTGVDTAFFSAVGLVGVAFVYGCIADVMVDGWRWPFQWVVRLRRRRRLPRARVVGA